MGAEIAVSPSLVGSVAWGGGDAEASGPPGACPAGALSDLDRTRGRPDASASPPPLRTYSEKPSVSIWSSARSDSSMIRRISRTSSSDSGMRSVLRRSGAEGAHDQRQRRFRLLLLGLLLRYRGDGPRLHHEQLAVGVPGERPFDVLVAAEVALHTPGDFDQPLERSRLEAPCFPAILGHGDPHRTVAGGIGHVLHVLG